MPLKKAAEYGYLSARCHVIRSRLIDAERLKELAVSRSMGELLSSLSNSLYAPFITETSDEGVHKGLTAAFEHYRSRLTGDLDKRQQTIFYLFFDRKYSLLDEKAAQRSAGDQEKIFRQIDEKYIESLKTSIHHFSGSEQRQFKKIIGSYFDLLNLYNLVKFRLLYDLSVEETLSHMLPYTGKFSISLLSEFCNVRDLQELSSKIKPFMTEGFEDYETFRKVLYAYHKEALMSVWSGYPFSLTIPLSLLRLIEIEILNLRVITEGISFGLDSKEILAMMVGE